jgi:hypothetical protein
MHDDAQPSQCEFPACDLATPRCKTFRAPHGCTSPAIAHSSAGTAQELERAIRSLLRNHSSPTIGMGDIHGGQAGYILYEPGLSFVIAGIKRHLSSAAPQAVSDTNPYVVLLDRQAQKIKQLEEALATDEPQPAGKK